MVAGDAKVLRQTYASDNQPLQRPPILDQFQFLPTNEIPASFTQGTATTSMSDVFAGDWRQLIIGQRLGFTVQTLVERYAELRQIGIVAHWRRCCIDPAARVQRLSVLEVELMWFSYGEERAWLMICEPRNVQTPRRSRVM